MSAGGGKKPLHIGDRKGDVFDEYIDRIGQFFRHGRRQHFIDDQVHIRFVAVFAGYCVRTEKGGNDLHRQLRAEPANHPQHF